MFRKKTTKTDIYWGLYHLHILVVLTSLLLFVPRLEVLLFVNHYFIVCIFKCCKSTRIFSLKILFQSWVRYLELSPPQDHPP